MTKIGDSASSIPGKNGSSSSSSSSTTSSSPEAEYAKSQRYHMDILRLPLNASANTAVEYPPRIPVALRHPHLVASVKQYRSEEHQQQLQHFIVSESFIPVAPDTVKPPRRRRRPPFSYSSLITQAILGSDDERMTLQEIYKWIMDKYPALYDAGDTGWQNTIRHNLSLNSCFKKIPKMQMDGLGPHGKGGYWTLDPSYIAKYKKGSFAQGTSSAFQRKEPREIRMRVPEDRQQPASSSPQQQQQQQHQQQQWQQHSLSQLLSSSTSPPLQPLSLSTTGNIPPTKCMHSPTIPSSSPSIPSQKRSPVSTSSQVMQIQNLLN